tara:strand:- start:413 stop:748 length:336 start_codon:yes stop_codon:yes gene_type:complete
MNSRKLVVIALSGLFLLTAWSSTWFEISAVGVYSEGLEREPTITTEYIIDSNHESFELSIENSTPLLLTGLIERMYHLNKQTLKIILVVRQAVTQRNLQQTIKPAQGLVLK